MRVLNLRNPPGCGRSFLLEVSHPLAFYRPLVEICCYGMESQEICTQNCNLLNCVLWIPSLIFLSSVWILTFPILFLCKCQRKFGSICMIYLFFCYHKPSCPNIFATFRGAHVQWFQHAYLGAELLGHRIIGFKITIWCHIISKGYFWEN